jgi:acyl-CoA synthetase (AMP-forming)/AMP-acid ligase II
MARPRAKTRGSGHARQRGLGPSIREALSGETLVDCLWKRAERPDQLALRLESLDQDLEEVTAGRLLEVATTGVHGLRAHGLLPGDRVFLVLPTGLDFVFLLWAALRGGATPVPAYPPASLEQLPTFSAGLLRMIKAATPRLVVVPRALREVLLGDGSVELGGATVVTPEEIWEAAAPATSDLPPPPRANDLALIQFSSGSTGDPRGVCLTHANVLANIRDFLARMSAQADDRCVTWLPLYHDMGLIGTLMGGLMSGIELALLPPTDFLRRPDLWLRLMGKYRATIGVAPQFAYNLCVRKVRPDALDGVDLSSVRVLLNGAEPIQAAGVEAFQNRFRPLGLRRGVVTPCYGLAEATLAACMRAPGRPLRLCQPAEPEAPLGEEWREPPTVVSAGPPMDTVEVRILGPDGNWLPDGQIGEICLRGPSVCRGIVSGSDVVPAVDAEGWLHTKDLGFLDRGELAVTGRQKDLIIIGGRNYYPQDLEAAVEELPGFRVGRVAAFGVTERERATEVLVVVAETNGEPLENAVGSVAQLRQRLLSRFGVAPYDTVLLKRGKIPITTSGKIRRAQTRADYERNALRDVVYRLRPAPPPTS